MASSQTTLRSQAEFCNEAVLDSRRFNQLAQALRALSRRRGSKEAKAIWAFRAFWACVAFGSNLIAWTLHCLLPDTACSPGRRLRLQVQSLWPRDEMRDERSGTDCQG